MGNLYMHTINGRPALYEKGTQICYFNSWNRVKFDEVLVRSLKTIKRQQKASIEWRRKQGYTNEDATKYGYVRISQEEQER